MIPALARVVDLVHGVFLSTHRGNRHKGRHLHRDALNLPSEITDANGGDLRLCETLVQLPGFSASCSTFAASFKSRLLEARIRLLGADSRSYAPLATSGPDKSLTSRGTESGERLKIPSVAVS